MVRVNVKWGKELYKDVELNTSDSVPAFKAQLNNLTNVPTDRQKLMAKGVWKGILKDDVSWSSMEKLVDGATLMLMGSADVVKAPEKKTLFVEDMTSEQKAETGTLIPSGLNNLGNTCYMNATLQCFRYIPEFRDALKEYPGGANADLAHNLTASLRDTFSQLDNNVESISPMFFVDSLRRAFPQFAQQGRGGGYMQQDSDEFVSSLFSSLSQKLVSPSSSVPSLQDKRNMIDALFGLKMQETLTCSETDAEPSVVKTEKALKLVCNITKDINHVSEGIKLSLEGTIEKNSDVLGRNAVWKKSQRIDELPKYLCLQFMRFYWKLTPESRDHTGVKCKMLRPITFPLMLDLFDFCSEDLQALLKVSRDKHAEEILNEFKEEKESGGEKKEEEATMDVEEKAALDAAKAMSLAPKTGGRTSAGLGIPDDFMGQYELFAVVTHKGRSADSGHYIGWARDKDSDDWFCFDDDEVSPCKSEDIQKLKGGGDWHMNYLTFYRAKK